LFTGDHIMGGSTVMIEDMTAYLSSLRRLQGNGLRRLHPGHGPIIDDPDRILGEYLAHRVEREAQILDAARGLVDVVNIATQAAMTAALLLFATRTLESRRWQ